MKQSWIPGLAMLAAAAFAGATEAAETRVLRLGMQGTVGDPQHQGVAKAAEIIAAKSDGRLKLEIFPNSQLGNFNEMLDQVTVGELDFTLNPFVGMDPWVPRAAAAAAAYVVRDFDHLSKIIASPWGQKVVKELEDKQSWKILDTWYFGTRHTTAKKPVAKLDDFKGLKLRVPNAKPLLAWAKAMGSSPTPVAFAEVYLALQTSQVDAQENPLPIIEAMKFNEVQTHISLTGHAVQDQTIVMSAATWDALPEPDRTLIAEAFKEGGTVNDKIVSTREAELIESFAKNGVTIVEADKESFRKAMAPVYEQIDKEFGAGTIKTLVEIR